MDWGVLLGPNARLLNISEPLRTPRKKFWSWKFGTPHVVCLLFTVVVYDRMQGQRRRRNSTRPDNQGNERFPQVRMSNLFEIPSPSPLTEAPPPPPQLPDGPEEGRGRLHGAMLPPPAVHPRQRGGQDPSPPVPLREDQAWLHLPLL